MLDYPKLRSPCKAVLCPERQFRLLYHEGLVTMKKGEQVQFTLDRGQRFRGKFTEYIDIGTQDVKYCIVRLSKVASVLVPVGRVERLSK